MLVSHTLPTCHASAVSSLETKMRIFGVLPFSLVLITFTIVSSAAGVRLQQLTPANFKESTENGLWLVEHFSPYCIHCRRFASTWENLVGDCEKEIPSVRLVQVDCSAYGGVSPASLSLFSCAEMGPSYRSM